jgi:hypothetical protein
MTWNERGLNSGARKDAVRAVVLDVRASAVFI